MAAGAQLLAMINLLLAGFARRQGPGAGLGGGSSGWRPWPGWDGTGSIKQGILTGRKPPMTAALMST